jgi:hypothetical protein
VSPPLYPVEVGLSPGTGCMVPLPYAAGGNRSYLEDLGCNRRPAVPRVITPTRRVLDPTYYKKLRNKFIW